MGEFDRDTRRNDFTVQLSRLFRLLHRVYSGLTCFAKHITLWEGSLGIGLVRARHLRHQTRDFLETGSAAVFRFRACRGSRKWLLFVFEDRSYETVSYPAELPDQLRWGGIAGGC